MARYDSVETQTISLAATSKEATFEGGVQSVVLVADTDCYVDFDTPAMSQSSLLVKANQAPAQIHFPGASVQKVTAIGTSGILYILGIRGSV